MERIDISDGRRIADLVDAVERGGEVVIVRDGVEVAALLPSSAPTQAENRPIDIAAIERFHAEHPMPRFDQGWPDLIREMRDMDDH